jgi:hypothetical protein
MFRPHNDPRTDPILLNLKGIATRGGERGPLYDQGVLSVIAQIEQLGAYKPSRFLPLIDLGRNPLAARSYLLPAEIAGLEHFLASRGWTVAEGAEFAAGVSAAESTLKHYRSEK